MAAQLFEGKVHAAVYKKYRSSPPQNLQEIIISYLEKKKVSSFQLALDMGCGSGQSTLWMAKRFEKVVGIDISKAQIEEGEQAAHPPNVSYLKQTVSSNWLYSRLTTVQVTMSCEEEEKFPELLFSAFCVCPVEELPFEDNSVDCIMAFAAAHWFDIPRFMKEVERVLKPSGCVALCTYTTDMQLHYKDCTEKLTKIYHEFLERNLKYANDKICHVEDNYKLIFEALPFQDKQRITDIFGTVPSTVSGLLGMSQSFSMYQIFLEAEPEAAKSLLQNTGKRILEVMGVSSLETPVEIKLRHLCVLGCKNF